MGLILCVKLRLDQGRRRGFESTRYNVSVRLVGVRNSVKTLYAWRRGGFYKLTFLHYIICGQLPLFLNLIEMLLDNILFC